MQTKDLDLDQIIIDGGTQQRAAIDQAHVDDLAEVLAGGGELPPGRVYTDGSAYWLSRGFHRYHAHRQARLPAMAVEIVNGTLRDAILDAVGDNADHGLKRTSGDKRKAVMTLLEDEKWGKWSDAEIARRCHVSRPLVIECRKAHLSKFTSENRTGATPKRVYVTKHGSPAAMDTSKIGRSADVPVYDDAPRGGKTDSGKDAPAPAPSPKLTPQQKLDAEVRAMIGRAGELDALARSIVSVRTAVTRSIQRGDALFRLVNATAFQAECNNAARTLRAAMPHAVCSYCRNDLHARKSCAACKGHGWVNELVHKSTPADIKSEEAT